MYKKKIYYFRGIEYAPYRGIFEMITYHKINKM